MTALADRPAVTCDRICGNCAHWGGWGKAGGVGDCARESEMDADERTERRTSGPLHRIGAYMANGAGPGSDAGIGWRKEACHRFEERAYTRRALHLETEHPDDRRPGETIERLKAPPVNYVAAEIPRYHVEHSTAPGLPSRLYAERSVHGSWISLGDYAWRVGSLESRVKRQETEITELRNELARLRAGEVRE